MLHPIHGLHHVTATVDDAQDDLDFCLGGLGLRLVKKTVNFDNHSVYHFYYGDERGTPGTIWTTFPYKDRGVPVGATGAGQVTVTSLSVPNGSLEFWRRHLGDRSIAVTDLPARFGEPVLRFSDRSGLTFELVGTGRDDRMPWIADGFDPSSAIRGLHSVTMVVRHAQPSIEFLSEVLGWKVAGRQGARTRMATGGDIPGHFIDIVEDAAAPAAVNGIGTVHHVAMAIATVSPGFTVDEELASLGQGLKLPHWEEGDRAEIEPMLAPVRY